MELGSTLDNSDLPSQLEEAKNTPGFSDKQDGKNGQSKQSEQQSRGNNPQRRRQTSLRETAQETLRVLPDLLKQRPELEADRSILYDYHTSLTRLDSGSCPGLKKARVAVIRADSFDAAIGLCKHKGGRAAVLNFASHRRPGGGWLNGAVAQEEALCYRSSLPLSLHRRYYPLPPSQGLYTRDVLIIRASMDSGHALLGPPPPSWPVVSVLTVPAVNQPDLTRGDGGVPLTFANPAQRATTKDKMRLVLRMAARHGHRSLVLGAMGCGAFRNPPADVAACWREVLGEAEFAGGWWEDLVFAVFDKKRSESNYSIFRDALDGLQF